jgi:hypothetical protein
MLHEGCNRPRRDLCEMQDIRAKHLAVDPATMLRPKYSCAPEPEYVVEEVYGEIGQLIYSDDGTLAFCAIRIA